MCYVVYVLIDPNLVNMTHSHYPWESGNQYQWPPAPAYPLAPTINPNDFSESTRSANYNVTDRDVQIHGAEYNDVEMSRREFDILLKCRAAAVFLAKLTITEQDFQDYIIPECYIHVYGTNEPRLFNTFWPMVKDARDHWLSAIFRPSRLRRVVRTTLYHYAKQFI